MTIPYIFHSEFSRLIEVDQIPFIPWFDLERILNLATSHLYQRMMCRETKWKAMYSAYRWHHDLIANKDVLNEQDLKITKNPCSLKKTTIHLVFFRGERGKSRRFFIQGLEYWLHWSRYRAQWNNWSFHWFFGEWQPPFLWGVLLYHHLEGEGAYRRLNTNRWQLKLCMCFGV